MKLVLKNAVIFLLSIFLILMAKTTALTDNKEEQKVVIGTMYSHHTLLTCEIRNNVNQGIIYTYHYPGVRERVKEQLVIMKRSGIEGISLPFWFQSEIDSLKRYWGIIPSATGKIEEPYRSNLINFLTDVKNTDFEYFQVSFFPFANNSPRLCKFYGKCEENWNFIKDVVKLIKQFGPENIFIDIKGEMLPSKTFDAPDYYKNLTEQIIFLYQNYINEFGDKDNATISPVGNMLEERLETFIETLKSVNLPLPNIINIHLYGMCLNPPNYSNIEHELKGVENIYKKYNLTQPLIIGETFYNDKNVGKLIANFIEKSSINVVAVFQWPTNNSFNGSCDMVCNYPPPYKVDNYLSTLIKSDVTLNYTFDNSTFENSIDDLSQYKNHGEIHGNPLFVDGVVMNGIEMDGIDDYISIQDRDELSGGHPFVKSVMVWFKVNEDYEENRVIDIIGKQKSATFKDWALGIRNGKLRFFSESKGEDYVCEQSTSSIKNGIWYYGGFVANEPCIYLYLNGTLIGNCSDMSQNSIDTDAPVEIGAATYGKRYSHITLDEVRIYNKVLTQEEIEEIFKYEILFKVDINRDGKVDIFDLEILASNFGNTNFNPKIDIDKNGEIDIYDLVFIASKVTF